MEEQELDIASICKLDKDNLLKCLTNKKIKDSNSGSQTVWMDLPKLYKDYINQHSKDISDYEKECEFHWLKFKYTRNKELWGYRKSLEENNEIKMKNGNKKSIIEKNMSPMFSKYFFEKETHGFIQKLENEPTKYHSWTGSSCPTSSVNIPSQSYNISSRYKFFHQGGQDTCVFSSLASALSYKGYNDASEIISSKIKDSINFGDPMTSAAALLRNSLQVVRYDLTMTITEPKEFPTIVQITAKHAISIYGEHIFDSNFHEPMQLNKDNLTRCCKNVSDEGFLGVIRGYIFSDD